MDWASGGICQSEFLIALARLKDLNIRPDTPGVTFAMEWGQGETESFLQTPGADYTAQLETFIATAKKTGFAGRIFVAVETRVLDKVWPPVQAAQRAIVDNKTIFQSCDCDSLGAEYRQDAEGHFNERGAAAAARLIFDAMQASGRPF